MKNTILLLLSLLLFCSSPQGRTAKVIEPEGLILRDKPTMQGRQLALMKEKEEVLVQRDDGPEETLFGRKSRWFEVKYRGQKGYAFGGFLEFTGKQNSVSNKADVQKELPKTITNSIGMEFVLIPAGEFMMGCSDGDSECYENEKPQHKVKITKPFYMGKYEVTQGQWKKVMGKNPSRFKNCGADCPVETVSWKDVQQFIKKLNDTSLSNRLTGQKGTYRLPTEAEWEYAARGSDPSTKNKRRYLENLDEIAWYDKNSGGTTHPVGKKTPNAFGLYDMLGNVEEWTKDFYSKDYYKSSPELDPKGTNSGSDPVSRGASWYYFLRSARSSNRYYWFPESRRNTFGFRLVLSP